MIEYGAVPIQIGCVLSTGLALLESQTLTAPVVTPGFIAT